MRVETSLTLGLIGAKLAFELRLLAALVALVEVEGTLLLVDASAGHTGVSLHLCQVGEPCNRTVLAKIHS